MKMRKKTFRRLNSKLDLRSILYTNLNSKEDQIFPKHIATIEQVLLLAIQIAVCMHHTCFSLSAVIFAWSSCSCFFRSAFWRKIQIKSLLLSRKPVILYKVVQSRPNTVSEVCDVRKVAYLRVLLHLGNEFLQRKKTTDTHQWHLPAKDENCM